MHVAQVEPVGLPVDLEEAADLEGLLDDASDVDVARPARADAPAGEMADAIDIRVSLSRSGLMPVIPDTRYVSSCSKPMAVPASSIST